MSQSVPVSFRAERDVRIREKLVRELGPEICAFLADPSVVEIMLNADGALWVERVGHGVVRFGSMGASQAEALMATIAAAKRTTIAHDNPILECELPLDGSRFEGLLPPVAPAPVFAIRRRPGAISTLADYMDLSKCGTNNQDYDNRIAFICRAWETMKYLKWILALAPIIGAIMSAPDEGVTKLAVMGKLAELAGEQSGRGLMGQAGAATMINLCTVFAPLAQQGNAPEDRMCQMIQRMQQQTRVLNLLAFNIAYLSMDGVPRIVCLGAVESVKCFASGEIADLKREAATMPKDRSITTPLGYSPDPQKAREEQQRTIRELVEKLDRAKTDRATGRK